jgi:hypothetical protein
VRDLARFPNRKHDRGSFYKYVSPTAARTILETRKLRWSSPTLFNDPFDVPRALTMPFSEDDIHAGLVDQFANMLEHGDPDMVVGNPHFRLLLSIISRQGSRQMRRDVARQLRDAFKNGEIERTASFRPLEEHWKEMLPTLRILCLTELPDNPPMWAHYADNHKGAVLELDCNDDLDSPWLLARPVIYQDAPPIFATQDQWVQSILGITPLGYPELFREYFYVKTTQWSYEKEWRVVCYSDANELESCSYWNVIPGNFKSVILGAEMADQDREALLALLTGDLGHVCVYGATLDGSHRRMTFDRL